MMMTMRKARLLDRQRQVVGRLNWRPPGNVEVDVADPDLAAAVGALVGRALENGLPLRSGGRADRGEGPMLVERSELVPREDERFLVALLASLNRATVAGRRVFGVLEPEDDGRAGA
jgi:hypothetical protein